MPRKATIRKTPRRPSKTNHQESIAIAIAELDQIKPADAKTAKAISLFKSWLADKSGYDEEAWPKLKQALDRERKKVGARRLFDA